MTTSDAQPRLHILADTEHFLVIDKPPGVCMHYQDGDNPILPMLEARGYTGLHLVHRLDTATSGLLLLAKTADVAAALSDAFQNRRVQKFYLAISAQKPKKKQGHVLGDLSKARRGNYKLTPATDNPAYTQFFSYSVAQPEYPSLRLFVLKPLTGKTHQLRVSLQSIGAPILGDARYAKHASDRMYLHAYQLAFELFKERYSFYRYPEQGDWFNQTQVVQTVKDLGDLEQLNWPRPLSKALHAI
ncbi:pseudouridine synthase [Alteromonas sp. ASW11-36]|uniref:Pseudouridine synthase n=1 Tax=Alteromonas arenosi TaxID=3055817 RepID=A0ABT7SV40_9ALTE|nr:pseudouridine synthase [Alteromonas sp. ASW11-36]MDM7860043.1 pseudouridine synthase [Alteromonas sp. ASW11-36]